MAFASDSLEATTVVHPTLSPWKVYKYVHYTFRSDILVYKIYSVYMIILLVYMYI